MQRRDCGLQHVGTAAAERQRPLECGASRRDLVGVPERPVLEENDRVFGEARVAPGVVHQHQREQSVHLGLVGHQLGERTAESDRLCREVAATAVALVEDQVDDREDGGDAVGKQGAGGTRNGIPAALILRFARTSRFAIVASGTRNARAISVVSPPRLRNVSATCASSASAG